MTDRFCAQCFGRGWVRIGGRRVTCTCAIAAKLDEAKTIIACSRCGDSEAGPWAVRDGKLVCEACLDVEASA